MALTKQWSFALTEKAKKDLAKLDKSVQQKIADFLERVIALPNPRTKGDPLKGNLRSYWRYRVGDYRIMCQMNDVSVTVLVIRVAHRREIYNTTIH